MVDKKRDGQVRKLEQQKHGLDSQRRLIWSITLHVLKSVGVGKGQAKWAHHKQLAAE